MYKIRVTYTKSRESSFIPYTEVSAVFERALVRENIEIIPTKDNKPYIKCAAPLPIGVESTAEICDILISEHIDEPFMIKALNNQLPIGMVVLSVEYINLDSEDIDKFVYAAVYEILPNFRTNGITDGEYEEKRMWYRASLKEYLEDKAILVLVKSETRNERIDIKPNIFEYQILINDALRVTVGTNTEYNFSPVFIMDGLEETVNEKIEYNIKRTKLLYR